MFIDVHILQTVPFSNLNRDENGTPKTVVYGGTLRARVSSQSWKRATRLSLEKILTEPSTYRTRNPDKLLAEMLVASSYSAENAENAEKIASKVFLILGAKGTKEENKKDVVCLFSKEELLALADVVKQHSDELLALPVTKEKRGGETKETSEFEQFKSILTKVISQKRPNTIALFGRMLAGNPAVNVDAAIQVAHAFSVHEIEIEDDFFTAAEDIANTDEGLGSAHVNYTEFVSATFYRFATIDFKELIANCNNDSVAAIELATTGLLGFCQSIPSGKNNATAPHSMPDMVSIVVRTDRPVSYAAAFETPIKATDKGYAYPASQAIASYAIRIKRMLSIDPVFLGTVTTLPDELPMGLGKNYESLNELIDTAVQFAQDKP